MNKVLPSVQGRAALLAALLAFAPMGVAPAGADSPSVTGCAGARWVGAWTANPTDALGYFDSSVRPTVSVGEQSYRIVLTPHWGGDQVRVRLTNRFRPVPLTIGHVTIATRAAGAGVSAESMRPITFGGQAGVTLAAGEEILSDPIDFTATAWQAVAVSVYLPGSAPSLTEHFTGNATSYYTMPGAGDSTADAAGSAYALTTTAVPVVSTLDVSTSTAASAVVALGDSITDGYVSADYLGTPQHLGVPDTDSRYPDFLQRRIDAAGLPLVVLNAGMSGNALLDVGSIPMFGPSMTSRLDADVLNQSGVSDVIMLVGVNDLDTPLGADYDDLIAGYTDMIARLHAAGLRVHLGTITPTGGSLVGDTLAPRQDPIRLQLNEWIRGQKISDTVIDFAAALQDPANPSALDSRYAGPDLLHPNPAGYHAMAEAIDLSVLGAKGCRPTTS